jgi:hypothetical protein
LAGHHVRELPRVLGHNTTDVVEPVAAGQGLPGHTKQACRSSKTRGVACGSVALAVQVAWVGPREGGVVRWKWGGVRWRGGMSWDGLGWET